MSVVEHLNNSSVDSVGFTTLSSSSGNKRKFTRLDCSLTAVRRRHFLEISQLQLHHNLRSGEIPGISSPILQPRSEKLPLPCTRQIRTYVNQSLAQRRTHTEQSRAGTMAGKQARIRIRAIVRLEGGRRISSSAEAPLRRLIVSDRHARALRRTDCVLLARASPRHRRTTVPCHVSKHRLPTGYRRLETGAATISIVSLRGLQAIGAMR